MSLEGAIAVHRFGLGARPGEIAAASQGPKAWLLAQLEAPAEQPTPVVPASSLLSGGALVVDILAFRDKEKALNQARKAGMPMEEEGKALYKSRYDMVVNEMAARFALGFKTERPFAERLVWFWTNHFGVSTANPRCGTFVGAFEREVIRPNIGSTFETMVQAAVRHPAMQLYLDNVDSIGPNSPAGLRSKKGLNENLGRELMELFTLGVDGGYTQGDVIAMAKLLTGFGLDNNSSGPMSADGYRYYPQRHEPGEIVLRGKSYPSGEAGTRAAITDLAHDKATAHHIAVKFATAFLADAPSPATVKRLEDVFNKSGGDLKALAAALLEDPHAFAPKLTKVRSPVELVTATYRLLDLPKADAKPEAVVNQIRGGMGVARMLGEFPMAAPSPKGWPLESDRKSTRLNSSH